MSSMFDYDDSINVAFNAKTAGKNLVTAKHEVLAKSGEFLFLAHSDREFALRCQLAEAEIESAALRKMANVSDSKAKLVRALHEEWKLRHANCSICKTALTEKQDKKIDVVDDDVIDEKDFAKLRAKGSKTAHGDMESQILEELEEIEQMMQCMCGNKCKGMLNGTPQCAPGQGCATNATPGACGQCGQSFHGHDVCSCKGGCGVQWSPTDESPADKVADHDQWAMETNHGRNASANGTKIANFTVEAMAAWPGSKDTVFSNIAGNWKKSTTPGVRNYRNIHEVLMEPHAELGGQSIFQHLQATRPGFTPMAGQVAFRFLPEGGALRTTPGLEHLGNMIDPAGKTDLIPGILAGVPGEEAARTITTCTGPNGIHGTLGCGDGKGCQQRHLVMINSQGQYDNNMTPSHKPGGHFQVAHWSPYITLVVGPDSHPKLQEWAQSYQDSLTADHQSVMGKKSVRPDLVKTSALSKLVGKIVRQVPARGLDQPTLQDHTSGEVIGVTPFVNTPGRRISDLESTDPARRTIDLERHLDRWGLRDESGNFIQNNGVVQESREPAAIIRVLRTAKNSRGVPSGVHGTVVGSDGTSSPISPIQTTDADGKAKEHQVHELFRLLPLSSIVPTGEKYDRKNPMSIFTALKNSWGQAKAQKPSTKPTTFNPGSISGLFGNGAPATPPAGEQPPTKF